MLMGPNSWNSDAISTGASGLFSGESVLNILKLVSMDHGSFAWRLDMPLWRWARRQRKDEVPAVFYR